MAKYFKSFLETRDAIRKKLERASKKCSTAEYHLCQSACDYSQAAHQVERFESELQSVKMDFMRCFMASSSDVSRKEVAKMWETVPAADVDKAPEPPAETVTKADELRCPECGGLIFPVLDFCQKCGRVLHGEITEKKS